MEGKGAKRFLFYSHDGAGLGHTRRNLAIARALEQLDASASVLLATGIDNVHRFGIPPGVDILKLPSIRKVDNELYTSRHLNIGWGEIRELRSALLLATVESYRPDVVLVDKHPMGAGGELERALHLAAANGTRLALGLRDILDDPQAVRKEWIRHNIPQAIEELYTRILVYGTPTVLDPIAEYGLPHELSTRTHFCGYVIDRDSTRVRASDLPPSYLTEGRDAPVVLATAGGGEDGYALLATFIDAARDTSWRGLVVTGPFASNESKSALAIMAEQAGVDLHTVVGGLDHWFELADAVVCMGGYNTLAEVVAAGTPAICVPRTTPRTEQLIRAQSFARMDLIHMIKPDEISVETMQAEIQSALQQSRPQLLRAAHAALEFDGASKAAEQLLDLAATSGEASIAARRYNRPEKSAVPGIS